MAQTKSDDYVIVKELFEDGEGKKEYVQSMFNTLAGHYDFMNSFLSLGIHHYWKNFAVARTELKPGQEALDLCTGTADIAIRLSKMVGPGGHVTGIDFSHKMLAVGEQKIRNANIDNIHLSFGNVESLELPDNKFDAVTVAFGIRNVVHLYYALSEVYRVLKPGGRFVCLEFSHPTSFIMRKLFDFYSLVLMPRLGALLVNDKVKGYLYLPKSIQLFPNQEKFKGYLEEIGFSKVTYYNLTTGIAALHVGLKPCVL